MSNFFIMYFLTYVIVVNSAGKKVIMSTQILPPSPCMIKVIMLKLSILEALKQLTMPHGTIIAQFSTLYLSA